MGKTIKYGEKFILVSDEIAVFLEDERKRQENESRSDRRHLNKNDFESAMLSQKTINKDLPLNNIIKNLMLEKLKQVRVKLTDEENLLIYLYFHQEWSMEIIGKYFSGISKMSISKRLKKLLAKMKSLMET